MDTSATSSDAEDTEDSLPEVVAPFPRSEELEAEAKAVETYAADDTQSRQRNQQTNWLMRMLLPMRLLTRPTDDEEAFVDTETTATAGVKDARIGEDVEQDTTIAVYSKGLTG